MSFLARYSFFWFIVLKVFYSLYYIALGEIYHDGREKKNPGEGDCGKQVLSSGQWQNRDGRKDNAGEREEGEIRILRKVIGKYFISSLKNTDMCA